MTIGQTQNSLHELKISLHGYREKADFWNSQLLCNLVSEYMYSKTGLRRPLIKKTKIGFQDWFLLNASQKYCRMLLSTFIKLPFVIKIFVLSILEGTLRTGFTVVMGLMIIFTWADWSVLLLLAYSTDILMVCPIIAVFWLMNKIRNIYDDVSGPTRQCCWTDAYA